MKYLRLSIAALCLAVALSGCGTSRAGGRPQVVASIFPLYEAAAKIGGKQVHAVNLLPDDPYGAVPAKQAQKLRDAPLAIVLGGGYQPEVDKIVAQRSGTTIKILGEGDFHASGGEYPWLDPKNMAHIAETIRYALMGLEPTNDGKFAKNLKRYKAEISTVDADYVNTLATCKSSTVMVQKSEFDPLVRRYGLTQVSVDPLAIPVDPVSKAVIEEHRVTTVFAPRLPALREAERIRDAYGVRVAVLDPVTTQTDQARRGGSSYRIVMGLNLDALRSALDCAPKEHHA